MSTAVLTTQEKELLDKLGNLVGDFIVRCGGPGSDLVESDMNEAARHIHALQRMVLAQAGARAYPREYRLMGRKVAPISALLTIDRKVAD